MWSFFVRHKSLAPKKWNLSSDVYDSNFGQRLDCADCVEYAIWTLSVLKFTLQVRGARQHEERRDSEVVGEEAITWLTRETDSCLGLLENEKSVRQWVEDKELGRWVNELVSQ